MDILAPKTPPDAPDPMIIHDSPRTRLWSLIGILAPIAVFWAACIRFLSPLPVGDDYDAVLLYLSHLKEMPTLAGKLGIVLFHQHNEYKPIWSNVLIALQYKLSGHVSFIVLSLLGDLQVMVLAWLLWRCFVPATVTGTRRLALFVPIALILFATNYAETLDWAMPGLQNLGVLTFALAAIWLISQDRAGSFATACVCLTMAIAASGNGFLVYPAGLFLLVQQRRFVRMVPWTLVTVACAGIYFTHYAPVHHEASSASVVEKLAAGTIFAISFAGSFGGVMLPVARYGSIVCGIALLFVVCRAVSKRFLKSNPALAGFALFLLLTSAGVAVSRSPMGYSQSLSGRYKIYSDLLLVCAYAFALHAWSKFPREQQRRFYRLSVAGACVLFTVSTAFGLRAFHSRFVALNRGIATYKASGGTEGPLPIPAKASEPERNEAVSLNEHFREALREASREGVYNIP